MFNDAGELVAVHWGGGDQGAYAVPLGAVRSFLREKARESFPQLAGRLTEPKRDSPSVASGKVDPGPAPPAP